MTNISYIFYFNKGLKMSETQQQAVLNIADIQNAIRIIDYAADQGAFKGWNTIEQVLIVRNRMNEFLKATQPSVDQLNDVPSN